MTLEPLDIWIPQAFLVALVQLPTSESAPPVDATFLTDPINTVSRLRKLEKYTQFWQLYDDAYDEFTKGYNSKFKTKAIPPTGDPSAASNTANNETENDSFPSDIVKENFNQLNAIFAGNPVENSKQSLADLQKNPPLELQGQNLTVYDWAEYQWNNYAPPI